MPLVLIEFNLHYTLPLLLYQLAALSTTFELLNINLAIPSKLFSKIPSWKTFILKFGSTFSVPVDRFLGNFQLQIADAVVVARYLRATLVVPDIRGRKPGDRRNFEDIYDVEKFIKSLDGVVKVVKYQPDKISARNLEVVRVPNRVTESHIAEQIEPIFRAKGNIRMATYFPSMNMIKTNSNINSVACLATFGTLELQPEVQEVVESMIERLRTLSWKSDGQFIAVDLRVDILVKKGCQGNDATGSKRCYGPREIAIFLSKIGFNKDTAIYLTQSRWNNILMR